MIGPCLVPLRGGTILLSNSIVLGSSLTEVMEAKGEKAFICHDLIPIMRPELAIDLTHAKRFHNNVQQLLQSDTTALCTSNTSLTMITSIGSAPRCRIKRFSMPSILHQRAQQASPIPKINATEPFVIYCSTVESRKNHLLLAKVWQQAIDEGVAFPKLVCVGKWGWGVDDLIDYLKGHPRLASQLIFTGPVSDDKVIGYYRGAIFGVTPSRMEGRGYCASECLDFGIPVVISTDPGLCEATRGMMPTIDPDDHAGWYAEVRRMAEDDCYRFSLCRRIEKENRPIAPDTSWRQIKDAVLFELR
jgi:glycosyltransferase involved in cell wall biosynthesis